MIADATRLVFFSGLVDESVEGLGQFGIIGQTLIQRRTRGHGFVEVLIIHQLLPLDQNKTKSAP